MGTPGIRKDVFFIMSAPKDLAIVNELYQHQRQYNTPISILPNDGVYGNLASNGGVVGNGFADGGVLQFSQRAMIRTIEFYSNSRYLLNQQDELGREKPFYNIVNANCDVEDAAKRFGPKDVSVTADDQQYVQSFLMQKDLYEWAKSVKLASAMKESKEIHTRYGGVLAKKVEKVIDGEKTIFVEFPEWKNVVNDQIDITNGIIIEKHYLTRSQLFEKKDAWDEDKIKEALIAANKGGKEFSRFNIYEIRGMFPRSFYKQVESNGEIPADYINDTDFSYQYYAFAEVSTKNAIPLYWEDDSERVYKYKARKKKAGRALGVGVVEEDEQAQIWINDTVQKQQRAFEHSARVVVQSASKKLKSRNVLTEVDDGQILEHEDGKPITSVPLVPPGGMAQFDQMINQWYTLANRASSTFDAQRGEKPAAGTAFRLQAMTLQQSSSVFEDLQQEVTDLWEEMYNDWFVPYLAKKINKAHILSHGYTPDELAEIDKSFAVFRANEVFINRALHEDFTKTDTLPFSQEEYDQAIQQAKDLVSQTKDVRFLDIPKDYYKDVKAKITINISGATKDKTHVLESLKAILDIYAKNPGLAQNPVLTKIFMEIVENSDAGISPVSMMAAINEQAKLAAEQAKNAPQNKVSESISFKDLPPDGQVQMAAQAGLKISPPQPEPVMQGVPNAA